MSEKVLGFKEKDAWKSGIKVKGQYYYQTFEAELVPVVSLQALRKYHKEYIKDNQYIEGGLVSVILDDLLSWAEKEAKKKGGKKE